MKPVFVFFGLVVLLQGCDGIGGRVVVDHPFYLWHTGRPELTALYRCPQGDDGGCAIDGLPGPRVIAAGATKQHVAVQQMQPDGTTVYYYFARVPEEVRGWGNNPEVIIGPISKAKFDEDQGRLGLPELNVTP